MIVRAADAGQARGGGNFDSIVFGVALEEPRKKLLDIRVELPPSRPGAVHSGDGRPPRLPGLLIGSG